LYFTISRAASLLGFTYHSAQDNIDRLIAGGVLEEITGRKRDRLYMARKILDAVERPLS